MSFLFRFILIQMFFCAYITKRNSWFLKLSTIAFNSLFLFLLFELVKSIVLNSIPLSVITTEGKVFIISGISYSICNSFILARSKCRQISAMIPQYLIYSVTYSTILYGAIKGLDQNIILGVQPLTLLVSIFVGCVTLFDTIKPYWKKCKNNLNQSHFLRIFFLNILIIIYNVYFDFTQFKTLGISNWVFLLASSTFWQIYGLDTKNHIPIVGSYLNKASREARRTYSWLNR